MNLGKLLRIARWEVTKNAGGVDRRTLAVIGVGVFLFAAVVPLAVSGGVGLDDDLYRVGVDEDSQYYGVLAADETFAIHDGTGEQAIRAGEIELLFADGSIHVADSSKGAAAYEEFRESVQQYNNRRLAAEENATAAFPIAVTVEFRDQHLADERQPATDDDSAGAGGDGPDGREPGETDERSSGETTGEETTTDETNTGSEAGSSAVGGMTAPLSDDEISGSPADISPPFPFQSLILAFVFIIPLNFLIQAYGSTMLSERLNRRGELMLVSPVSRLDIIGGKTLPYFLGAMLVEGAIAVGLVYVARGELGGIVSTLAIVPLVFLFLAATFLGAMFARSFKELTFITVTITVVLTSYAFVPAIFTDAGALALISPLTLVVHELQGEAVSLSAFAFSTLPPFLTALVFFGLGSGLYREEDLFAQRSLPGKVLDALAVPISRPAHVGAMTIVLIPFVFVLQLLAIALLFALGSISIVLILIVVAVLEEVVKSLHVYAAYDHNRFERTTRVATALGIASGVGFFIGEKIALLAQLVGLPELAIAEAGLMGGIVEGPILLGFLLAPLALHVVTATLSAVGASRGRRYYLLGLSLAIITHLVYNLAVVMTVA